MFVVNGGTPSIDIIDISDPTSPTLVGAIDISLYGDQANSVAVKRGVVVAAVEDWNKQLLAASYFSTQTEISLIPPL